MFRTFVGLPWNNLLNQWFLNAKARTLMNGKKLGGHFLCLGVDKKFWRSAASDAKTRPNKFSKASPAFDETFFIGGLGVGTSIFYWVGKQKNIIFFSAVAPCSSLSERKELCWPKKLRPGIWQPLQCRTLLIRRCDKMVAQPSFHHG